MASPAELGGHGLVARWSDAGLQTWPKSGRASHIVHMSPTGLSNATPKHDQRCALSIALCSDCRYPSLVYVAPDTIEIFALCACTASAFSVGTA
jgi:hypothetical protein